MKKLSLTSMPWWRWLLLIAGVAILGVYGAHRVRAVLIERTLAELPTPVVEDALPNVAAQLQRAYEHARQRRTDPEANAALGMVLHAYNEYPRAAICYERARRLAPRDYRWAYLLGVVRQELGEIDTALALLERTIELRPQYTPARLRLADALYIGGEIERSRALYESVIAQRRDLAAAYLGYGNTLVQLGELAAAREQFQRALNIEPDYGSAHYAMASVLRALGEPDKISMHLQRYELHAAKQPLVHDPILAAVASLDIGVNERLTRALALGAAGNHDDALRIYEEILKIDPENAVAAVNMITASASLDRMVDAERYYARALELFPNWSEAHYLYGRALAERGDYATALAPLRSALAAQPEYPDALTQLGLSLEQLGRNDEAAEQFRTVLEYQPGHRPAHLFLGMRLYADGDAGTAQSHLQIALAPGDPRLPQFHQRLAQFYANRGEFQASANHLLSGMEIATTAGQYDLANRLGQNLTQVQKAMKR